MKRPIDGIASNVGHCLWCGIVDDDAVDGAVAQLTGPALALRMGCAHARDRDRSGTTRSATTRQRLAARHRDRRRGPPPRGRHEEAVADRAALVDASRATSTAASPSCSRASTATDVPFPVRYPTSCSPQAWAAGAALLMLRSLLRLDADVPRGLVRHAATVPRWLGDFTLDGLVVAGRTVRLEVRDGHVTITGLPPGLRIVERGAPGP